MTFQIIWGTDASAAALERMLSPDGGGVERVAEQITAMDRALTEDPSTVGESRDPGVRVDTINGLTIYFEPHDRVRIVYVKEAVFFEPRSRP